jgi:uncharacterized protein (TIGR00297 family)
MHNDTTVLLVLGAWVAVLTVAMETLDRRRVFPQWLARKVLHVGAVGACALAPLLLVDLGALIAVVLIATLTLLVLVGSGRFFREASGRPGWGIALFPIPYIALLLYFNTPGDRWLIALPMAILAVSDAAAAVVGTLVRTRVYHLTKDRKTIGGSIAFATTAAALIMLWPGPLRSLDATTLLLCVLVVTLLLTVVEALGSNGWDNVFVPGGAAVLLMALVGGHALEQLTPTLFAIGLSVPFVVFTVNRGWLTLGGAMAAVLLGCSVVLQQGAWWLLPLLLFFASSTALGKLRQRSVATSDAKHGRPRDAEQVFSNGGIYLLAAALLSGRDAQLAMAVSMAIATADTWASEIGMAVRGRTYDIIGFRPVPAGLSGGISVQGTLGGAVGAALLAVLGGLLMVHDLDVGSLPLMAALAAWGMAGMLADSLLGGMLQARYRGAQGHLQDQATGDGRPAKGLAWMTNDRVNLLSNALITGLAVLLCA